MDIVTYLKEKAKKNLEKSKQDQQAYESGLEELNKYLENNPSTTATPNYERYEYDSPSDEVLSKSAQDELKGYLESSENAIRNEFAEREKELNKNLESNKNLFDESSRKLKETYETSAEALSNDALKRGLARSSIALNGQIAAGKAYNDNAAALIEDYNRKISEIDSELDGLSGELRSALDSFRIDYAAKLTKRINELKSEREKNEREAIEYNNKLLAQEYQEKTAAKSKDKYSADDQKQNQAEYQKALYEKMMEVLSAMPLEQAKRLFNENNSLFRDNLGDVYYYSLYTKFKQ